jgi:hypothetical protein
MSKRSAGVDSDPLINSSLVKNKKAMLTGCKNCSVTSRATVFLTIVGLSSIFSPLPALASAPIEAYLSAYSVKQGDTIQLFANTALPTFNFRIYYHEPNWTPPKATYEDVAGVEQFVPAEAWSACCAWTNPVEIEIPESWKSGIYTIQLSTDKNYPWDGSMLLSFIVREDIPGATSDILVIDNVPNYIAYNQWGGASAYWHQTPGFTQATSLSVNRPGNNTFQWQELAFMNWAQYMGIDVEYASLMDIESDPDFLSPYQTLVIVGHSEYWSRRQRDAVDNFKASGGNLIVLGGNTMWWQARFEANQMLIYKDPLLDPLLGLQDELVTGQWHQWPVNDPENRTIGLSYRHGGFVNDLSGYLPATAGHGGYTVARADHRLFAGTGLANGSQFGRLEKIVGYEVDGAQFTWSDEGLAVPTGEDGTPSNFEILATAPADTGLWQGFATMGIQDTGYNAGRLFNAATILWVDGLYFQHTPVPNPYVHKIILNLLAELAPESAAACLHSVNARDFDSDEIHDACDNCIAVANADQLDTNENGTGDLCEASVPVTVKIDIEQSNGKETINLFNKPTLNVAVLSESSGTAGPLDFDATQIDVASLRFGPGHAAVVNEPSLGNYGGNADTDMTVQFNTDDAGLQCEAEQLIFIDGQTLSGLHFEGMQHVQTTCVEDSCHP